MAQVLRQLPAIDDPRVLIDAGSGDDAAVYRISDERALVATVDFFTPIVDDAYTFGAIAAANALSDVYAMGARPLFALNLVAWPRDGELLELLGETLRGGVDKVTEAGAFILGGHSIDDKEPKYGLVVIGEAHPDRIVSCGAARPGDKIILTKPLGTGILSTALKRELIAESDMAQAIASMTTLNDGAARAVDSMREAVSSVTDVTGFGLIGHLANLVRGGGRGARIDVNRIPVFGRVRDLIAEGAVPGGSERNLESARQVTWSAGLTREDRVIVTDAQTSGGLLIAIAADRAEEMTELLLQNGTPTAAIVGEITDDPHGRLEVMSG